MGFLLRFSETCKLCSSRRLLPNMFFTAIKHDYGDSWRTLKNKQNGSKSTNHNWQAWPVDMVKANFCFLRGPLRWLTAAKTYFIVAIDLSRVHVSENHNIGHKIDHNTVGILRGPSRTCPANIDQRTITPHPKLLCQCLCYLNHSSLWSFSILLK